MNKQELIKKYEKEAEFIYGFPVIRLSLILEDLKQLDEPEAGHADEAPRYVKNILARLRELPLHDREVWLKAIVGEFERDFSSAKWREGYEQGKFEGMFVREKVVVPQFVADWIEYCKEHNFTLFGCLDPVNGFESLANETFEGDIRKCIRWCRKESNNFARAWLDGYEIEQEKRYLVKMKGVAGYGRYLNKALSSKEYFFASENEVGGYKTKYTRKELKKDGFGWVFDCPGVEVKEVKE